MNPRSRALIGWPVLLLGVLVMSAGAGPGQALGGVGGAVLAILVGGATFVAGVLIVEPTTRRD